MVEIFEPVSSDALTLTSLILMSLSLERPTKAGHLTFGFGSAILFAPTQTLACLNAKLLSPPCIQL